MAEGQQGSGEHLGCYVPDAETVLAAMDREDVVGRIWRQDHTVWKSDPTEITDRLGWLTVTGGMARYTSELAAFSQEARQAGFRYVVLLGMGGSSLGPEALRQTFGSAPGFPELIVLDSTLPARVIAVERAVDPAGTLFVVSSKSGSTIEPNTCYAYFRRLVEKAVGAEKAGDNFVAVTDAGTSLETLAAAQGFRRVFLNPSDIGGRYSVLSYFGLTPAALMGIDIDKLLARADRMKDRCLPGLSCAGNPGARLGAIVGMLAQRGRDKVTLVTSPAIGSFGIWAEQLLAESTGKEGTGIVPIANEPLGRPEEYGDDRLFVYLRLEGDDNEEIDSAVESLQAAGHPVVRVDLHDKYDVGAEFFRWEFATAVAGSVLKVNPFDQPDVQSAKDMTDAVLDSFLRTGSLPHVGPSGSLRELLDQANPGDYLAVMVYAVETPGVDKALQTLRRKVMQRYKVATTASYGPRHLHSTGQLHKGGPGSGLFLQLITDHYQEVDIPGQSYSFGLLADAQAAGDLQALRSAGRRSVRVHLGSSPEGGINRLIEELR